MSKITDTPHTPKEGKWVRKYATKEEGYEAHKARVKAWQDKNRDKVRGYQAKYEKKPERRAIINEKYANMDPAKKEQVLARQREYNKTNYTNGNGKKFYEEHKEEILAKARAKYAAMSPEEKEAFLAKKRKKK